MRYNVILSHYEFASNPKVILNAKEIETYELREIISRYKLDEFYILEITPAQVNYNSLKEDLDLPARVSNALLRAGCENVLDVLKMSREELKCIRNLGNEGVNTILKAVKPYGRIFDD